MSDQAAQHTRGFTLIETMLSIAIFGTLLTTVLTSFATGQRAYHTSEAFLLASQSARTAIADMEQQLSSGKITAYRASSGTSRRMIQFKQIQPAIIDTGTGKPSWQDPLFAYVWCQGGQTGGICKDMPARPTLNRELLLAQSLNGGASWQQVRIVATNLNPNAAADPLLDGFVPIVRGSDGTPLPEGSIPMNTAVMVELTIRTAARVLSGPEARSEVRARVYLRNPQDSD